MTSARETAAADNAAIAMFSRLDTKTIALLLDVDGTIIDIASTPHDVHVPLSLCRTLERLFRRMGGALALVSGRPVADLDRLFSPLKLPSIGGHGAETRLADEHFSAAPLPAPLRQRLAAAEKIGPGIVVENKIYSLALHYRNAPEREDQLRRYIAEARAAFPDEATEVLPGKAVFEVKRPGISKGEAVRALTQHAPFRGRQPIFIGDDVTDESVFAILPELGGTGFSVQREFDHISGIFHSPEQVRLALEALAGR